MLADSPEFLQMLGGARQGHPVAMRKLLSTYEPHLRKMAKSRERSMPDGMRPSDLVQDTLERVVRFLKSFHGETDLALRKWLGRILRSVLAQRVRAARRLCRDQKQRALLLAQEQEKQETLLRPSQAIHAQQQWHAVLRTLHGLPPAQRDVLRRFLRGESVAAISQAMGKTPAAISCLLQRGGQRLQTQLGHSGPLDPWFAMVRDLLASAP